MTLPLASLVLGCMQAEPALAGRPLINADGPPVWRAQQRLIDTHVHVGMDAAWLERAVRIMDAEGIGVAINLSGGTTTRSGDAPSEFERNLAFMRERHADRFAHCMNLDYGGFDDADFSARAVQQINEGHRLGAAGLKEYKRLGLYERDGAGKLIAVDDRKLDPVWQRCGELGMPVFIHTADPKAFWRPFDETNERWEELHDHKDWWFGDPAKFPSWDALMAAQLRVVERHPETTFVSLHFASNSEDALEVGRWLDRYPNLLVDIAARVPEIGRQAPEKVRAVFEKHQERILFATDFMVYDHLILGSGGNGPPPTDDDARSFFEKHWRYFETNDRGFAHMTPIQGNWTIDAIGLGAPALRKIYFDNARRLLVRSLPPPVAKVAKVAIAITPGAPELAAQDPVWQKATPVWIDQDARNGAARPELATEVRLLWSDDFLHVRYRCPFTQLTVFGFPGSDTVPSPAPPLAPNSTPPLAAERMGLWEKDVVELFVGADASVSGRYSEIEVAPTGEKLDVAVDLPAKDFSWSSGCTARVVIDDKSKVWSVVLCVPLHAISAVPPTAGTRWSMNLYRCDRANGASLAWRPVLGETFHAPDRFGVLEFQAGN